MFKIGDRIVYPMHGAGIIEDIEEKEILGETKAYYILKIPVGNMKIMVPVDNSDMLGIRDVVEEETIDRVIDILGENKNILDNNWNRRYRDNLERIKSGDILEVAEVVKDLYIMDVVKGLSTGEKKMLNNAKQILLSELALSKNVSDEEAEGILLDSLKK
ncbi:MAG TPA: CarD family transcriptional regulator [Eubacteriaceae bacterium]|nr:CarD family transcriptional regulator [Eubacteriaceae bacterium]